MNSQQQLRIFIRNNDLDSFRRLLAQEASENGPARIATLLSEADSEGKLPLHWICMHERLEFMNFICDEIPEEMRPSLAQVQSWCCARDTTGTSALHCAATNKRVELAARLLHLGSDANIADENGNTALHRASLNGNSCMIRLLLREGRANIEAKNNTGSSALDFAILTHKSSAIHTLIEEGASVLEVHLSECELVRSAWAAMRSLREISAELRSQRSSALYDAEISFA